MRNRILSFFSERRSTVSQPAVAPAPPSASSISSSTYTLTPTLTLAHTCPVSSISHHLHDIKKVLQDVASDANIAEAEIHDLEQVTSEVLRLIRYRRNRHAPINRIPPKILTLIPDFWNEDVRDRGTIALAHVCQAWREIFASRSSLLTDFYREDLDTTHLDLDILALPKRYLGPLPRSRPLQITPHATAQLKSVVIHGASPNLEEITAQLPHPAPLLESLRIEIFSKRPGCDGYGPMVATTLFNGDLSSLHELCLRGIDTELPWRNMVNLTSFTLATPWGGSPLEHLLDFFESAPRLRKIRLHNATQTYGAQSGRLVSLMCLERMDISGSRPPSLLLDHLLIPDNAKLSIEVDPYSSAYIPRSLCTIREITGFTIHMHVAEFYPNIRLSGSDWEINVIPATPRAGTTTCRALESLARFDISNIERLRLAGGDLERDECAISIALEFMKRLRTLTISRCKNLSPFISTLSSWHAPNLEELILDPRVDGEKFDVHDVVAAAEGMAKGGEKAKYIGIVTRDKIVQSCVPKLKQYALHVECSPRVALLSDDIDGGDGED